MADTARDRNNNRRPIGRSLSGGGRSVRPIALTGANTLSLTETIPSGQVGGPPPQEGFPIEMALAEASGPWRRDRITLSLEAQVVIMEMKSAAKDFMEFAGHIYSNLVSKIKIAAGRFLVLEPFGGYRLLWKN